MKKRQKSTIFQWMLSLPGVILMAAGVIILLSAFPATAQAELSVMSEVVVDPTAGADWHAGSRNLNERIGRADGGLPSIVYTAGGSVNIFWCDDMACTSGTSELVLPDDGTGRGVMLSPVVYDAAGGPNFSVSVYDLEPGAGYYTYVQCSPSTCANPTEWGNEPDPPATPMKWSINRQAVSETGLLLKSEDSDAPIILMERNNNGFDYFDCDDGQYCDPIGVLYAPMTQHVILDAERSGAGSTVTNVMSRSHDPVNDFEAGWGSYTGGGNDCRRNIKDAAFAHGGSYAVRLRDNSGAASSFYSSPQDLSAYSQINISFWYQVRSFENSERFVVEFFDGANWQLVASYVNDIDFVDDGTFYNPTVSIDSGSYDFSNAAFRFRSDASGNADKVYIDDVVISAF